MQRFLDNLIRDLHLPQLPFWMVSAAIIFVVATWVPLALVARTRVTISRNTRVHVVQDMDTQPKYKTQNHTLLFADGRSMRRPVEGTVSRSEILDQPHLTQGYELVDGEARFFETLPPSIMVDEQLLLRGQERYNIYCFPCHGLAGQGNGPVHKRAARLMQAGAAGTSWVQPSDLTAVDTNTGQLTYGPELYPDGKLYNVIVHGIRNMPAYGDQIGVRDRWAIVAYVRALQVSQSQPGGQQQAANASK